MLKTSDMSNTIPDEKTVVIYLTYLCTRLLGNRNEQHAASVIQLAWRRHQARRHQYVSTESWLRKMKMKNGLLDIAALCRIIHETLKH